jgi:flagellar biosynthetic protein FlhB
MAERSAAERTEPATPERLKKARQEGKVPQSQEVPSALTLAVLLVGGALAASTLWRLFESALQWGLTLQGAADLDRDFLAAILKERGTQSLAAMAPLLVAMGAASVLGSVAVSGWTFAPRSIRINPERLNPAQGLRSLFSPRSAVHLVSALAKLAAILAIVLVYLRERMDACLALAWATPMAAFAATFEIILGVLARVTIALGVIALLDALYQRWQHRRDLRMTRQELKEERRQHEIAPEVRGRIRAIQFEMVRRRMLQEVPKADVVVANPDHVAVALRYDTASMDAPTVVAKGADRLCEKIKEIARTHGVPIVYRPELARAMYRTCEVGEPVPEALYVAVAEVLAWIYRMRKPRGG